MLQCVVCFQLFEYDSVVTDQVDVHFPVIEMLCNSKISCVSWNCFHKGMLASSDYEGTVTLWDAFTGEKNSVFQVCLCHCFVIVCFLQQ
jgi:E3 ubiquitin-protein ligase RFWD2